jgi:cytidylate kinase
MIIAIDGPAGAGKSTIAKLVAKKLGFLYIDTGAMYRALTLKIINQHIDSNNVPVIITTARVTALDLVNNPDGSLQVFLDGSDVSAQIRGPKVTRFVSDIAKIPEVREVMVALQRSLGKRGNSVLEGRDIGSVVFPDAQKKFYLDAEFSKRTQRRWEELKSSGQSVSLDDVAVDLRNRDTIDSTRKVAPLKKTDDAIVIDTTAMTIDEVVNAVLSHCPPS